MRSPKPTTSYGDIVPVVEEVLRRGEVMRYRLPSFGQAINFRQRFYKYRNRKRSLIEATPGFEVQVPEDMLELRLLTKEGTPVNDLKLKWPKAEPYFIEFHFREPLGQLYDAEGHQVPVGIEEPAPETFIPPSEGLDLD